MTMATPGCTPYSIGVGLLDLDFGLAARGISATPEIEEIDE
jgi:hypothetical protein